jgi:hypothetical protein
MPSGSPRVCGRTHVSWGVEDDPDLARPVTGVGAGLLAIVEAPLVSGNERAAVVDPVADWL